MVSAAGAALAVENSAATGFHLDASSQGPGSWKRLSAFANFLELDLMHVRTLVWHHVEGALDGFYNTATM